MLSRRRFMAGLGASLVAAPFCQLLSPGQARAEGGRARRLLIFFSPNGTIHRFWRPEGEGRGFTIPEGSILAPLIPWRDRLLVLDGLDFWTGDNHEGGMAAMLTNGGGGSTETRGMSLDQYVASRLGAQDRFPSVELGILTDIWGGGTQTRMAYAGPGQLVHPDADPRRAFERLFASLTGDEASQARLRARRQSVLDLIRDEVGDLHRRVGRAEQLKLEAHLEALRGVEQSLFSDVSCPIPTAPEQLNKDDNANVPQLTRDQIDLAVLALACGMTRVASVQLSHTVSPVVFSWVGNTEGHHSLSHTDDNNAHNLEHFVNAERWCASMFAYLLERLDATPEADGDGTLLDNTVVLWAKELGDSRAHVCDSVPFVLAGRAGGAFSPGRYLKLGGRSHAHLLVSVCEALGLTNQTFGDPSTGSGGLSELA